MAKTNTSSIQPDYLKKEEQISSTMVLPKRRKVHQDQFYFQNCVNQKLIEYFQQENPVERYILFNYNLNSCKTKKLLIGFSTKYHHTPTMIIQDEFQKEVKISVEDLAVLAKNLGDDQSTINLTLNLSNSVLERKNKYFKWTCTSGNMIIWIGFSTLKHLATHHGLYIMQMKHLENHHNFSDILIKALFHNKQHSSVEEVLLYYEKCWIQTQDVFINESVFIDIFLHMPILFKTLYDFVKTIKNE